MRGAPAIASAPVGTASMRAYASGLPPAVCAVPVAAVIAGAVIVCAAQVEVSRLATARSPLPRSTTADSAARGTSVAGRCPVPSAVAVIRAVPVAPAPPIVPAFAIVPTTVTCAFACGLPARCTGVAPTLQVGAFAYWIAIAAPNAPLAASAGRPRPVGGVTLTSTVALAAKLVRSVKLPSVAVVASVDGTPVACSVTCTCAPTSGLPAPSFTVPVTALPALTVSVWVVRSHGTSAGASPGAIGTTSTWWFCPSSRVAYAPLPSENVST